MSASTAIRRLAILNRGEAAIRCIRSVKALRALEHSDLESIAIYTDVDRDAPFVRHADRAVRLPMVPLRPISITIG
jgi:acetyl/propionyl-CoA carboxylase alpha subunit